MLKLSKTEQVFRQGHEELFQLSYQTVNLMVADLQKFAEIGIDQSEVDNLKSLSDKFKARNYDEFFLLDQKMATEAKNKLAEELRLALYRLELKLKLAYGKDNSLYQMFNLSSLSTLDDADLAEKGSVCAYLSEGKFSKMVDFNLDQVQIDLLKEKANLLRTLVDLQVVTYNERHTARQLRIEEANTLYKAVSRIRNAGRKMWAPTDYARSQAYLMPKLKNSTDGSDETETDEDNFISTETETTTQTDSETDA